jgi:hypothetical protein
MRLPKAKVLKPSSTDRARLARWLHEWRLEQALRDVRPGEPGGQSAGDVGPDGLPMEVGQVRLFKPFNAATVSRPRYFVVLERVRALGWEIVPFGRFAVPAVPGEWSTGLSAMPLRVLCIWNAGTVLEVTARRSWIVDQLPEPVLRSAADLHRHAFAQGPLSAALADQIGPVLVHPLDPRIEYIEEERSWMNEVALPSGHSAVRDLPMAAESREGYGTSKKPEIPSPPPPDTTDDTHV